MIRIKIREKILEELTKFTEDASLILDRQNDFFWFFNDTNTNKKFRVFKLFLNNHDGYYVFQVQKYIAKNKLWKEYKEISVQTERFDDEKDEFWKDPEPIRPCSLQGLRIRLHQAYRVTENIYESFYLVSNELYESTLDTVSWFEDKKEDKEQNEHVMGYNMLKFFQAFEIFKEDLNSQPQFLQEIFYGRSISIETV